MRSESESENRRAISKINPFGIAKEIFFMNKLNLLLLELIEVLLFLELFINT